MDILRSIAKSLMGTIFALSLVSLLIVQNMVVFTSYDNLKPIFEQIASGLTPKEVQSVDITQGQLDQVREELKSACAGKESIDPSSLASQVSGFVDVKSMLIYLSSLNLSSLKCANIEKVLPANASSVNTASIMSGVLFDSIYYKNYSCGFMQCIANAKSPTDYLVLISSTGNSFLSGSVGYLMIAVVASLALFVLLTDTLAGKMKSVGWGMLSIGIAPFIFKPLQSMVLSKVPVPPEVQSSVSGIVETLSSHLFNNFTIVLVIGIALLVAGYGIGFMAKKRDKKRDDGKKKDDGKKEEKKETSEKKG